MQNFTAIGYFPNQPDVVISVTAANEISAMSQFDVIQHKGKSLVGVTNLNISNLLTIVNGDIYSCFSTHEKYNDMFYTLRVKQAYIHYTGEGKASLNTVETEIPDHKDVNFTLVEHVRYPISGGVIFPSDEYDSPEQACHEGEGMVVRVRRHDWRGYEISVDEAELIAENLCTKIYECNDFEVESIIVEVCKWAS
ncbi:hypothetical protein [Vibrio crassostreae]|uniref:hypothetical protein n=1 Tax=Vibrio crassostreae TaxID=246167 RepID=UPI001B3014D1|nr:hypothetical protein [Vibrio crassostreae]